MHHLRWFLLRLRNVLRPHDADPDLAREMSAHLALLEDEYVRRGLSREEARRQARIAFGGVEQAKELHRGARSFPWIDDALRDVRYAARLLRRAPVFAVTAILSLAIAIGATTTVFTAVNALLARTAPGVADPDRLVDISRMTGSVGVEAITQEQYAAIHDRVTSVEQVYAYALVLTPMSWTSDAGAGAQAVFTNLVTSNFFTALGVTPAAGRMFTENDTGAVVVLSHRFWRERYQGNPGVIGSAMHLGDTTFTIVGVARREFHGNTILAPDLWLRSDGMQAFAIGLVGARLKAGVALSRARAEIESIGRDLPPSPDFGRQQPTFAVFRVSRSSPVPYGVRLIVGGFLGLLMAIVSLVLIVACTNVAGLLLARGASRARETAVRVALGVSRTRLVRQLFTETIILFTAGGAAGLLSSRVMNAAILRILPTLPLPSDPSLVQDGGVVSFALGLSFVSAVVFGLAPAVRASRVDVLSSLKAQDHGGSSTLRLRRTFVVAQVALSVVLVVVGGLLTRALARSASVDRGFDGRGVDVVSIDLGTAGYTPATGRSFVADVERRLASLSGVESAAVAALTPNMGAMGFQIGVPGVTPPDGRPLFDAVGNVVTPGYFATLRIPLLAGRDFGDEDAAGAARAVILSQAAARRFWPALRPQDAVGRQLLLQPNLIDRASPRRAPTGIPITVVGVAENVRGGMMPGAFIYLPMQQQYSAGINILVRARGEDRAIPRVRDLLLAMDRRLPILAAGALDDQANPITIQLRISAAVAGSLGVVGVLLAAIGVYGVTSFMVARRTREIGIRVALGADTAAVVRMALGETAWLLGAGGAVGVVLAAAAARVLRGLQPGVEAADPVPFCVTLAIFAIVGLAASYVPVRRALAVDPSRALRSE
jgi:predicted permease